MRLFLAALLAFTLVGCGGDDSTDGANNTIYFVGIRGTSLDNIELSDEDFERLERAPIVTVGPDGKSSLEFRLAHGEWLAEFTNHLSSDERIPAITIVTANRTVDGDVMELERDIYQNALMAGQVIHSSDASEHVDYHFTYEAAVHSDEDVFHDVENSEDDEPSIRSFQPTRYVSIVAAPQSFMHNQSGSYKFPAVAQVDLLPISRANGLYRVSEYTISLFRSGNLNPGFRMELVQESTFPFLMQDALNGQVFPSVTLYQIDEGRPARLTEVYTLQNVVIEDPFVGPGGSNVSGMTVFRGNFAPLQYKTYSFQYDRLGRYTNFVDACINLENGPERCQN